MVPRVVVEHRFDCKTFLTLNDDNTRILCLVDSRCAGLELSFRVLDEAIDV